MTRLIIIFIGAGTGGCLRFLVGRWIQDRNTAEIPSGTLVVNLLGCLLIGLLAPILTNQSVIREEHRLAILVGLLGGFTTFSAYSWETINALNAGRYWQASANVLISNAGGLTAAWLGSRAVMLTSAA